MKNQTVVGIFNTAAEAKQAVQQLATAGFELDFVDVSQASSSASGTSSDYTNTSGTATEAVGDAAGRTKDSVGGFFSSLFGSDNDEADTYAEVTRSGHSLVTVHVDTAEQAHKAADILDNAGALDVDSKAAEYGVSNSYTANRPAPTTGTTGTDGMTAEVIEESLQVGKRTEQTGGVRLRSRIVEKPVEASVRLREEHVTVQRKPVNRVASEADFQAFKEGDVTLTESAERAVVAKEAHVIEEVSLGKQVTEREEVIHDTVRNTEVDVEQIPGSSTTTTTTPSSTQPGKPGRA
ncbi:MAG: DUF2382 domain-containing protein [Cytophagaceae bacterium]|nr:MAG: DUF2382 domain-containing protein [Cytophagaceae bacterium]